MSGYVQLKIVVDGRMYESSGIGTYVKNILSGIKHDRVKIIAPADLKHKLIGSEVIPCNLKIYSLKELLLLPFKVPKCDVFWSPHYNVPFFWIPAKRRVVTIHDVYHVTPVSKLPLIKKLYSRLLIQWALLISDKVITVSDFSKTEILKYFQCAPSKIEVINNGVKQVGVVKEWEYIQSKYKLPAKYLLFVGNVKPHKNIRGLLEAYLKLSERHRELYKVVIVGAKDGFITKDSKLFTWVNSNPDLKGQVIFTGFVADCDMDSIYHYASLFVFPSLYEGFGLPPLEAMINKCPVVASNVASIVEICKEGALYFNPTEHHEIAELIDLVLNSDELRKSLIKSGSEISKSYVWENSIIAHRKVFS